MIRYQFREPFAVPGAAKADPQKVGEALAKITEQAGGELTPSAVVESAKNKRSPLHQFFQWDDAIAAEAYRLDQARALIRSIIVAEEDGDVHAYLSVNSGDGVSYRTVQAVRSSRDLQARVLVQAEKDLESFERRYRELTEVCERVREARDILVKKRGEIETRARA